MKISNDSIQLAKSIEFLDLSRIMNANIHDITSIIEFDRGEYLIEEGAVSSSIFFLLSGEVKIFSLTATEKILCRSYYCTPEIIGEASSLWGETPVSSVQAMAPCKCIAINLDKYRDILINDIKFMQYISRVLSKRLNGSICNTLLDPLEIRLAKFILEQSIDDIFRFNLTECAEIIITSYRHLLRVIKSLCDKDLLLKTNLGYKIMSKERLQSIASGDLSDLNL